MGADPDDDRDVEAGEPGVGEEEKKKRPPLPLAVCAPGDVVEERKGMATAGPEPSAVALVAGSVEAAADTEPPVGVGVDVVDMAAGGEPSGEA